MSILNFIDSYADSYIQENPSYPISLGLKLVWIRQKIYCYDRGRQVWDAKSEVTDLEWNFVQAQQARYCLR